eukprot:contig_20868_g5110
MAVLNRVADAMTSAESSRAERFQAILMEAQWTNEYPDGRLALAERMVSVKEKEAALLQQNNDADQRRKTSESITACMLHFATAYVTVP